MDQSDERAPSASGGASAAKRSAIFAPGLLEGQVALVTGGGTGLGRATALELVRCGATVVITGRRLEVLEQAVGEAGFSEGAGDRAGAGGRGERAGGGSQAMEALVGDVRDRGETHELVSRVLERHGRLDLLVNNAGGQFFSPAELISPNGWRAVWRLNVEGMLNMSEAAHELAFRDAGRGTVVNVTLSPHHGMPGMAHSGAARAAVEALTRELAKRWVDAGVTVSAVAVGVFETEALGKYPESVRAGMSRTVPLQRLGGVLEHAWLVAMLASPLGGALNGSTITLDGARDNWWGAWPPPGLADEAGRVPVEERR
jgi:citronellol/citronellal dehydrogenase